MQKIVLFAVIFSVAVSQTYGNIIQGKCAAVPIRDFNVKAYLGLWYEQYRYDYIFERSLTCVTAEYGSINSTHVTVRNGGKNKDTGKDDYLNGYANIINLNEPNKLNVHLPIIIAGVQVFMNSGQYNVLETDYNTYTVIYSCTELPLGYKKEIAWIMTREKTVDDALVQRIITEWKAKGVNTDQFIKIDHSCQ